MNLPTRREKYFVYLTIGVLVAVVVALGFSFNNGALAEDVILADDQGDLKACHSDESSCSSCRIQLSAEEMANEYPFIDILAASVEVTKEDSPLLLMKLEVADSIPVGPSNLTSYSFALDLDGDPNTGFRADRSPLGVFPDLGVDLWVNLSLNRGNSKGFVFVGPKNIKDLTAKRGLLERSFGQERKTLAFTVPVEPIERKLTFAYLHKKPQLRVEQEEIEWVAFTTRASSGYSEDNPICDFHPDRYFQESPEGCLLSPLL